MTEPREPSPEETVAHLRGIAVDLILAKAHGVNANIRPALEANRPNLAALLDIIASVAGSVLADAATVTYDGALLAAGVSRELFLQTLVARCVGNLRIDVAPDEV